MVIVVCGVAGAGKTTVGQLLARELRWKFYDGDDFHPPANIEKMHRGIALTDKDRQPWLERLRYVIKTCLGAEHNGVLACSALKKKYRDYLRVSDEVKLVFLRADFSLLEQRLGRGPATFDPKLLRSQLADCEEPQPREDLLVLDTSRNPAELVDQIKARFRFAKLGFKRKKKDDEASNYC